MAINDVFELGVTWQVPGSEGEIVNVIHYRQTAYDGVSSDTAMGNAVSQLVIDGFVADLMQNMSAILVLDRIDWFVVNNPIFGGVVLSGAVGGEVADIVSLRSTPVIKKITELRGRSFQGRIFLPPVTENFQTRGIINSTLIAAIQATFDNLRILTDGGGLNDFTMTVFSRTLSTLPSILIDNLVQTFVVNPVMGSLRGRQEVT